MSTSKFQGLITLVGPSFARARRVIAEISPLQSRISNGLRSNAALLTSSVVLPEPFGLRPAGRPPRPRARARRGRPGRGQDPDGQSAGGQPAARLQADPVHPRPHALRRHRPGHLPGWTGHLPLPGRPRLHQPGARRRDQPHARQDPGRPAGGHGGTTGHRRRPVPPPALALPGRGHPEPRRVRGHLPAARGAAGPVPRSS